MLNEQKITNYMLTKKYDEEKYNCWDFVREVYQNDYNYELPEYPMGEVPARFKDKLKANIKHVRVNKEDAKNGDIVIFSLFSDQHAGIMLDDDNFVHMGVNHVTVSQISNLGVNYAIYRIIKG